MSKALGITPEAPEEQRVLKTIAPAWHTAGVVLLLAVLVILSVRLRGASLLGHPPRRLLGYTIAMGVEWLIVGFIWLGTRFGGVSLRTLTGGMSTRARAMLRDLGLAVAFLVAANTILAILARAAHAAPNQAVRNLLPRGGAESAVFLLLALTAGVCEEVIFRGYLQQQFAAWTRSAAAGIIAQGLGFGVSHWYQGPKFIFLISVYGCLFGCLARWRRSLRPGMMAHFLQDGVEGLLLARYALK